MFLFHKSVEQYRRPKTFDQYCIYIYIWTPRSITLPRSRFACGVTNKASHVLPKLTNRQVNPADSKFNFTATRMKSTKVLTLSSDANRTIVIAKL